METGPLDARLLRDLFLEAMAEPEDRVVVEKHDNVVIKGYLVDADSTIEPSVVNVLNELDRRARQSAA
jgi:hypothetical protein